jgi:hypothetical protein
MKRTISLALGAASLLTALTLTTHAETLLPGQVDLGKFTTANGDLVEVNVSSSLIALAAHFVEKDQPDVASLLRGIHLVRVNVVGMNEQNRAALQERAQQLRQQLDGQGWERIVSVHQQAQDVGIYLKTLNKDTVQGLVITVLDGDKQAVFVNVVGNIKPEQLSMLGERLHIDPLKEIGRTTQKPEADNTPTAPEK